MEFWGRHILHPQSARHRYGAHERHDHRTGPLGRKSRGVEFPGWSGWLSACGIGISVLIALSWTTIQPVQVSAEQGVELSPGSVDGVSPRAASAEPGTISETESAMLPAEPAQGPALIVPEEIIAVFQQRKLDLDRREKSVRTAEGQLSILKAEVEEILRKVEAIEQRLVGKGALGQEASRIERMPDRKALEILRLLKSKSAGAILAQVKVDRAAKLTEELLATP